MTVHALDDLTVLDLSAMLPGQTCTMVLGDLGAEVIKIERPGLGDYSRHRGLPGSFESANRNKRSITLDLKQPEGREVLLDLATRADVLVEGFRPGVVGRLGLGYESVAARNPRLIYCSISGYGQSGSQRDVPGHDPQYLSVAGVLSLAGAPNGAPSADVGVSMADMAGAWFAAIAVLAAVRARDRHGFGQYIDLALADSAFALVQNRLTECLVNPTVDKVTLMSRPGVGLFEAADGRYLTVGAVEDHFWLALCETVEALDLRDDPQLDSTRKRRQHGERIRARLANEFRRRTRDEWVARLQAADVPCAAVRELREAAQSQYANERDIMQAMEHPVVAGLTAVRFPPLLSMTPAAVRRRPPLLGEHTDELLREIGYTDAQLMSLRSAGTI